MIRVSSSSTNFRRKILPIVNICIFVVGIIYKFIFKPKFGVLDMFIIVNFFSIVIYLILYRNIKNVFFEEDYLLVDNRKLYYEQMVSIENTGFARYRIHYKTENKIKSFPFITHSIPFFTPKIIYRIEDIIKKAHNIK
jgi:hypothetical protein